MGKSESKPKKEVNKLSVGSKINQVFDCPYCNKKFAENMTYDQLNQHLKNCGLKQIQSFQNINSTEKIGFSCDENLYINTKNKNKKIQRRTRKYSSLILKEISKNNKINCNLILAKSNDDIIFKSGKKEEKNKKKIIGTFDERYNQMLEYFTSKKNQFKTSLQIKGENILQILSELKNNSIYQNIIAIIQKKEEQKKYTITELVYQYFDYEIKHKRIEIINGKTISFSFRHKKIDFEIFGYILAILLIYTECKINYKMPHLICKLILNEKLDLNDIQYENKALYDYLFKLKNGNDFSELNIYFNYEGNDLILNGNKIKVNEYNCEIYIDRMIEYEINKYKKEIDIMKGSLFNYVPNNFLMNFKGEELYRIFNRLV